MKAHTRSVFEFIVAMLAGLFAGVFALIFVAVGLLINALPYIVAGAVLYWIFW